MAAASDRTVIIGTDDCESSSWRFDGSWKQLASIRHEVAVVAIAYAEEQAFACSASRDGVLMIWSCVTGAPVLQTFVDFEPMFVGFVFGGEGLCMIDRSGEVHVWKIETLEHLGNVPESSIPVCNTVRTSEMVKQYLNGAGHLNGVQELNGRGDYDSALRQLSKLPPMPDRQAILLHWHELLESSRAEHLRRNSPD